MGFLGYVTRLYIRVAILKLLFLGDNSLYLFMYLITFKERNMDFLTSSILSGVLYDGFRRGASISSTFLKEKLQGWILDDVLLERLTAKVKELKLQDYGEHVIERKLDESESLQKILEQIKPDQNTTIGSVTQNHSGSGDNIVGNKTVYHK